MSLYPKAQELGPLFAPRAAGEYPSVAGAKEKGSTSELAAIAIESSDAKTLRRSCLEIVKHYAPISADEAARMLQRSVLSVRPRFSELRAQGLIEPSDERTENESGMSAKRWRLAQKDAR